MRLVRTESLFCEPQSRVRLMPEIQQRYEKQLGIGLNQLANDIRCRACNEYCRNWGRSLSCDLGTDVAFLLESENSRELQAVLSTLVLSSANEENGVKALQGEIDGVSYTGMRSKDRSRCSYIARLENVVLS